MVKNRIAVALALIVACPLLLAAPREDRILTALRKAHPQTTFSRVAATPLPGIYAVWMGENVAFVAENNTRYLIFGHLFDTATMRDLTQTGKSGSSAASAPARIDLSRLPQADAITTTRGSGERQLVVFSDPQCGYCRQLERELANIENVTIKNFIVPINGIDLAQSVWCAADRQAAWLAALQDKHSSVQTCPNPFERNRKLAAQLGIQATPTLIFGDGRRVDGYMTAAEIEAQLSVNSVVSTQ